MVFNDYKKICSGTFARGLTLNIEHVCKQSIEHFFRGIFSNVFYYEESNWKTLKKKFHGFSSFFKVFQVFSRFFKIRKICDENFQVFLTPFSTMTKKNRNSAKKKNICCSFCLKNTTRLWNPCLPTLGY